MDVGIVSSVAGGGVGGGALMAIVGLIRGQMKTPERRAGVRAARAPSAEAKVLAMAPEERRRGHV